MKGGTKIQMEALKHNENYKKKTEQYSKCEMDRWNWMTK